MNFLKSVIKKIKEWLNKNDAPKYLSGKTTEKE